MRPATYYYLAENWPSLARRRTQREAPPRSAGWRRYAYVPRHGHRAGGLTALARRVLTVLGGTSQAA